MAIQLTTGLVLAAAGQTEYSRSVLLGRVQSILVSVVVVKLTSGFGDQLDVSIQGGNDGQNWFTMSTTSFAAAGPGQVGPVTGPTYRFCRVKYVFTSGGSGSPCIVSATLEAKSLGVTVSGAAPAPPV